jgi:hypothetical protein
MLPLFYLCAKDKDVLFEENAVFVLDGGFTWVSTPELTGGLEAGGEH